MLKTVKLLNNFVETVIDYTIIKTITKYYLEYYMCTMHIS